MTNTEQNQEKLKEIAKHLLTPSKGILAADESNGTADKRLESFEIETGEEMRRKYRDMLLCTPGLENYITGVIMFDETFWQNDLAEHTFPEDLMKHDIYPGIKVDLGMEQNPEFNNEQITNGLEDLNERLEKYAAAGAKFTKWRALFEIDEEKALPSEVAIRENSRRMAEYAKKVQENGMVPIVEPEVLLLGKHYIAKSEEVTTNVVKILFEELEKVGAYLPGLILKTSMVISGNQNEEENSPEEIADATVRMLKATTPSETGGVVFLSGGQTAIEASAHLNAIAKQEPLSWEIAFSYARALQEPALRIWAGKDENVPAAREEFLKRLKLNQLADQAEYDISLEYEF